MVSEKYFHELYYVAYIDGKDDLQSNSYIVNIKVISCYFDAAIVL